MKLYVTVPVIGGLNVMTIPMARSIASKLVQPHEQGMSYMDCFHMHVVDRFLQLIIIYSEKIETIVSCCQIQDFA